MLVLTRKLNESIVIGDDIVVTITQLKGSRVAVGIEAPRTVNIRRSELRASAESNMSKVDHLGHAAY